MPDSCPVGVLPGIPAFDPSDHELYVPNEDSGNISILSTSCREIGSINLSAGAGPSAIVYDPADAMLYVLDSHFDSLYVISGRSVIHIFHTEQLHCPTAPMYDPALQVMVVGSDCGRPQLNEISGISIVGHVGHARIWTSPADGVFDPSTHRMLVTYEEGANVTFYSPRNFRPLGSLRVDGGPLSIVYDPSDGLDYVASYLYHSVTIFSSAGDGKVIRVVQVGSGPMDIAYSPATHEIYVANSASGNVSVINGTVVVGSIPLPNEHSAPFGLVYNPATRKMYVTNDEYAALDMLVQTTPLWD
jgi:DNA-binding beta-propeller fold protein YncE